MGEKPNRNKLYAKATASLREKHRSEFEALLHEEYKAAGLTYRRRLTAEERAERDKRIAETKAAQKVMKIQEEFPDLGISLNVTPF